MSKLNDDIRESALDLFNRIVDDPNRYHKRACRHLIQVGIEPGLDEVLSYITGIFSGYAAMHSSHIYSETRTADVTGVLDLLTERAWILRETFMKLRNK